MYRFALIATVLIISMHELNCKPGPSGKPGPSSKPGSPPPKPLKGCQANSSSCLNDGVCHGHRCECANGWQGKRCELDACSRYGRNGTTVSICKNGGQCILPTNTTGFPECINCNSGYSGDRCQLAGCSLNPCQNGGTCTENSITGYSCTCGPETTGRHCERRACDFRPCMNNSTCTNFNNGTFGASCECLSGYTGNTCNIQDCSSQPCLNNGTCTNGGQVRIARSHLESADSAEWRHGGSGEKHSHPHHMNHHGHGGHGQWSQTLRNFTCACPSGFAGFNCGRNEGASVSLESGSE